LSVLSHLLRGTLFICLFCAEAFAAVLTDVLKESSTGVARWFLFSDQKSQFGYILEGLGMEKAVI
jgi:hypothetical protein